MLCCQTPHVRSGGLCVLPLRLEAVCPPLLSECRPPALVPGCDIPPFADRQPATNLPNEIGHAVPPRVSSRPPPRGALHETQKQPALPSFGWHAEHVAHIPQHPFVDGQLYRWVAKPDFQVRLRALTDHVSRAPRRTKHDAPLPLIDDRLHPTDSLCRDAADLRTVQQRGQHSRPKQTTFGSKPNLY